MNRATYKYITVLFLCFSFFANAQNGTSTYSKIVLDKLNPAQLTHLAQHDIYIDHFKERGNNQIEIVLADYELAILNEIGIPFRVRTKDVLKKYNEEVKKLDGSFVLDCGLTNFTTGSMNGYHTYEDVVAQITLMENLFPEIVDVNIVGQSIEGRNIYSVKISDNVNTVESDQEGVVYYDALTHAREPISLEASLYYMWWLLENYGNDDEASYLVNNREIYFIPIVNVDGYVFNQTTNPSGGGFWRKNRRASGNNCFGVDLNRNYGFGYGLNSGSSSDPCSNTYRGEEAFSEPESATVRDFVAQINPSIAFSIHTYGDVFLSPFGYADILAEYDVYAEFVSEFIPEDYRGYGTTAKMLGYTSSGTTRDYLHSEGIYAWTPEIGGDFWEPPSSICPLAEEFLKPMKYLSWVSGAYTCFHDFELKNENGFWKNDTIQLDVRLKNRGLSLQAEEVTVELISSNPNVIAVNNSISYGTLDSRSFAINPSPFQFLIGENIELLEEVEFDVVVRQAGSISYTDKITLTTGIQEVLFFDDAESGMQNWSNGGIGHDWDTTAMDKFSGNHSFCDSNLDNYLSNTNNWITMMWSVNLDSIMNPFLEYNAKWSIERNVDFATLRLSMDNGITWITLATPNQANSPGGAEYTRNSHWVQEKVDLSLFTGQEVLIGFQLSSNQSVHGDGFYFDDFKIVDYQEGMITSNENIKKLNPIARLYPNPNPGSFEMEILAVDPAPAMARVFSIDGKLLSSFNVDLVPGKTNVNFNLSLTPGTYNMDLRTKNYQYPPIKFIVN